MENYRKDLGKRFQRVAWKLFVVEAKLLEACPRQEQKKYTLMGLLMLINFGLMALASLCFSSLLLYNRLAIVGISILFFISLFFLYLLLLTTISSNRLPHTQKVLFPWSSVLIRCCFLLFISLLIAKPTELLLFKKRLEPFLVDYRQQKEIDFYANNLSFIDTEIFSWEGKLQQDELPLNEWEQAEASKYVDNLCSKRQEYIANFRAVNASSTYLAGQFVLLHRHFPWIWGLSFLVFSLIMIPFLGKLFWLKNDAYQMKCDNADYELITRSFLEFKTPYQNLFKHRYGISVAIYDDYLDPPFNKRKKTDDRKVLGLDDLRRWLKENPIRHE